MANTTNTVKKVKIKLPLTRTEKADEYVAVNGHSFQIKRGEEVEVPYYIADALRCKEEALAKAFEYEAQVADKT